MIEFEKIRTKYLRKKRITIEDLHKLVNECEVICKDLNHILGVSLHENMMLQKEINRLKNSFQVGAFYPDTIQALHDNKAVMVTKAGSRLRQEILDPSSYFPWVKDIYRILTNEGII